MAFSFLLCMAWCAALDGESFDKRLTAPLVSSCCKTDKITITGRPKFTCTDRMCGAIWFYLSPEGLEVMTQIKYSLAAKESSTLFTSLVKLPSTCLLLNSSALLCVSDLSAYTGTWYSVPLELIFSRKSLILEGVWLFCDFCFFVSLFCFMKE